MKRYIVIILALATQLPMFGAGLGGFTGAARIFANSVPRTGFTGRFAGQTAKEAGLFARSGAPMGARCQSTSSRNPAFGQPSLQGGQQSGWRNWNWGSRNARYAGAGLAGLAVLGLGAYYNRPEAYAAEKGSIYTTDRRFNFFNEILDVAQAQVINRALYGREATSDSCFWLKRSEAYDHQISEDLNLFEWLIRKDMNGSDPERVLHAREIYPTLRGLMRAVEEESDRFRKYRTANSSKSVTQEEHDRAKKEWVDALKRRAKFTFELIKKTKEDWYVNEMAARFKNLKQMNGIEVMD